jgi:hypothetical protein
VKRVAFFAGCCVVLMYYQSQNTVHAQVAHLTLQGGRGEFVSGGGKFDLTFTPQNTAEFFVRVVGLTNGLPSSVDFTFIPSTGPDAILDFGATPLVRGKYKGAVRTPGPGKPSLWVAFDSRGGNTTKGSFIIQDAIFAPDPNAMDGWDIVQFDATFNQRTDGKKQVLHGTFSFTAGPESAVAVRELAVAVPEPTGGVLIVLGAVVLLIVPRITEARR